MARQLSGAELIAQERRRQIEKEGWTAEHDDDFALGTLTASAVCYSLDTISRFEAYKFSKRMPAIQEITYCFWPWKKSEFKPTPDDPIRELTKAGALIAAEIDRLQRIDQSKLKNLIE